MIVRELLVKYKLFNSKIEAIAYHLSILNQPVKYMVERLTSLGYFESGKKYTEEEKAIIICDVINKCDINSDDYNSKLDENIVRICLKTNKFPKRSKSSHMEDDGNEVSVTSILDDYNDSLYDLEQKGIIK